MSALRLGLLASGVVAVAALLDQVVFGSLKDHVRDVYAPYRVSWEGANALLFVSLLVLGVAGMAGWLVTSRVAARGARGAAPLGTVLFLLGLGVAVTLVSAQEYGHVLVPAWLGLLNLLPSAVGVVATVQLWRQRRPV